MNKDETCVFDGCKRRVYARTLCNTHYPYALAAGTLPALPPRACDFCGEMYMPKTAASAFCPGGQCKERARSARRSAEALEARTGRICIVCSAEFTLATSKAVTCSPACGVKLQNDKKAAR